MDIATTHPRIFGVDFSGAAQAGKKIWIAGGQERDGKLIIDRCCRAADLSEGSRERGAAYLALRALIRQHPTAIFGIDAPFGVPAAFVPSGDWVNFIRDFARTYQSPDDFRARCRIDADGREARRVADRTPHTPFAPANLRLYRQTYHAIAGVLAPLLAEDAARALPMQAPAAGKPLLVEICPALTLRALDRFGPYKGRTPAHRQQRRHILNRLTAGRLAPLPNTLANTVLADTEGDALDSIIAAWTIWRLRRRLGERPVGDWEAYRREGYVYSLTPDEALSP